MAEPIITTHTTCIFHFSFFGLYTRTPTER